MLVKNKNLYLQAYNKQRYPYCFHLTVKELEEILKRITEKRQNTFNLANYQDTPLFQDWMDATFQNL